MKIIETPPLPPFGTANITTKHVVLSSARSVNLTRAFGSALIFIFRVVLGAVKRSTRNKNKFNPK